MLDRYSVLFVEDDKNTQKYMKMLLEDDVGQFYTALDGDQGLDMYKKNKPDIILTDINMPNKDGLSMIREIRKTDKKTPIIVISSYDNNDNLLKAINLGSNGFITKPVDVTMLLEKLESAIEYLNELKDDSYDEKFKELYREVNYDKLTNIPNRYLFEQKLESTINLAKEKSSKIALFFIDLDKFKNINDSYGHNAGDFVLKNFVKNVKSVIRQEDTFGRRSGDEFLLFVENADKKRDIALLAKKITEVAEKPIKYIKDNLTLRISCSIGISIYPKDSLDIKELIHFADLAMYKAKRSSKGSFKFYSKKKI